MASISLADQLDDAIEMMIAEPDSAPPKVDLKIGELLGIAAELRLLPDPAFRAALRAELLGQNNPAPAAVYSDLRIATAEAEVPWREQRDGAILPTLSGEGYGNYPFHLGNIAISMAIHAAVIAVIAVAGWWMEDTSRAHRDSGGIFVMKISVPPLPADARKGGGGGGGNNATPASKGALPRFANEQLTPPTIVVRSEPPKLAVDPTLVGPPELTMPTMSQIGDPLSKILSVPSTGYGSGGGIGDGRGAGFGTGSSGGMSGGAYRVGGGVSAPRAIYDPDPEYSDEARQAKFQGTVVLWAVVGVDGRARGIRVARSLGMGLDEKAVAAVGGWKFEPGRKGGVPVPVQVTIEVSFRLL